MSASISNLAVAGVFLGAIGLFLSRSQTVKCKETKKEEKTQAVSYDSEKVVVINSRAVNALLTKMRSKNTPHDEYVVAADRLLRILSEEALAYLPSAKKVDIETPCGPFRGWQTPDPKTLCGVSIMRSGDILLEQLRLVCPGIAVGKILIQRDENHPDKIAKLFYSKLPQDIASHFVILVDPMLATGGSAITAINELVKVGVQPENVLFLNVVSAPEGIAALHKAFPQVKLVTAAVDSHLNAHKYIVPGLGDFGDRYYRTG